MSIPNRMTNLNFISSIPQEFHIEHFLDTRTGKFCLVFTCRTPGVTGSSVTLVMNLEDFPIKNNEASKVAECVWYALSKKQAESFNVRVIQQIKSEVVDAIAGCTHLSEEEGRITIKGNEVYIEGISKFIKSYGDNAIEGSMPEVVEGVTFQNGKEPSVDEVYDEVMNEINDDNLPY